MATSAATEKPPVETLFERASALWQAGLFALLTIWLVYLHRRIAQLKRKIDQLHDIIAKARNTSGANDESNVDLVDENGMSFHEFWQNFISRKKITDGMR